MRGAQVKKGVAYCTSSTRNRGMVCHLELLRDFHLDLGHRGPAIGYDKAACSLANAKFKFLDKEDDALLLKSSSRWDWQRHTGVC